MAFKPGYESRVLLGPLHLTTQASSVSASLTVESLDTSVIVDKAKTSIPGQDSSVFAASGPLDVDSGVGDADPFDVFTDFKFAGMPITYAPEGLTALDPAWMVGSVETSFESRATPGSVVGWSLNARTNGITDMGFVLEDLSDITTSDDGDSRDLTASSGNGGVAHLHVTAYATLTSDDILVEQSANGSSGWTTIATFAQVDSVGSERVEIAAGTSVDRYLRVTHTVAGSGSLTYSASFARR
jgi:hypothetical protein